MEKKLTNLMVNVVHPTFISLESHLPNVTLLTALIQNNVGDMSDLQFALMEFNLRQYKLYRAVAILSNPKGNQLREYASIVRRLGNNILRIGAAFNQGIAYEFHALREFWSGLANRKQLITNPIVQSTIFDLEFCMSEFLDLEPEVENRLPKFEAKDMKSLFDNIDNAVKQLIEVRLNDLKAIQPSFPRTKPPKQYISEARIFLTKELKQYNFGGRPKPDRVIRQFETRPGETLERTIEFYKKTVVEGMNETSALEETSEEVEQSLQNEKKNLESVRTNDKTANENYIENNNSLESGWDVSLSAGGGFGPVSANIDAGAYADTKAESITKDTINTETNTEKVSQNEINAISQQNEKTNHMKKIEAREVSKTTSEELNRTVTVTKFTNPNPHTAWSVEYSQGAEPHDLYIAITDVELVFSNGFEKQVIPLSNLKSLEKYVTDDFDMVVFKDAIKALSETNYKGTTMPIINEKDGRLYVDLKNTEEKSSEQFDWGIPIKYKQLKLLSEAIIERTYLVSEVILSDETRVKMTEESLFSQELDNDKKDIENRILEQKEDFERVRVVFGKALAESKDVTPQEKNKFAVGFFNQNDVSTKKLILDYMKESDIEDAIEKIDPEE